MVTFQYFIVILIYIYILNPFLDVAINHDFYEVLIGNKTNPLLYYKEKKRKYEPPVPTRVGKKKKKLKGPETASKLPKGT